MNEQESIDLLNAHHQFPCPMTFKAIGSAADGFVGRVVAAVRDELGRNEDPPFRTRSTKRGNHVAVTLEPTLDSAEQVLAVYRRLRDIRGVLLTM